MPAPYRSIYDLPTCHDNAAAQAGRDPFTDDLYRLVHY